jgi:hypothetical protein
MQQMSDDVIIEFLEGLAGCYRKLSKLAELQHEHVQQNQIEGLLTVLQSRQVLLDEIMKLERAIAPVKREWNDYVGRIDADRRAVAESLLGETRQLLEEITRADQDDALVLQQRKLNLGRQINQATAARQINRNYGVAAYGARPSRMDVQR